MSGGKYRSHAEKVLAGLIRRNDIPLAYTGKATFWIRLSNGKSANPDFINAQRKKIVEVYGGIGSIHTKEEAAERVRLFKEKGWDTLIVTDSEIYMEPKKVVASILAFTGPTIRTLESPASTGESKS